MTKPDDIPQNVWDKAVSAVKEMNGDWQIDGWDGGIDDRNDAIIIVARAIMAAKAEERNECAQIVEMKEAM